MFDHRRYVPILKGRDGEYGALNMLAPVFKDRITPLIEIPPIPWDFQEEKPARSIDVHLRKVAQKIERSWGAKRALFIDLLWIAESERMEDGSHPVLSVFSSATNRGLAAIPVVNLVKDEEHLAACSEVVQGDRRGICIRLQREDFLEFPDLRAELKRIRDAVGTKRSETDIILDLRALSPESRSMQPQDVIDLVSAVPDLASWRTFTVSATSFPENLMGLPPSEGSTIARDEWRLWTRIIKRRPARLPSFGDYAISHPEPSEVDPRIMRPSASIRYTADTYWLVLKARNLRDHGYQQFHEVCRELREREEYSGRSFSWGDCYIDECADEMVGTGNLTTWRKVGTSHHIAFVLRQLSSLFGA